MKQLIAIHQAAIADSTIPTCNARDLHAFLEVQTQFKDWIVRRIEEYSFEEGKDFCSNLSESTGGRPAKEYALSLDMAKELSMVERTEKGKQARQYFIDCERRAKAATQTKALPPAKQASEASKAFNALFRTMRLIGLDKNAAAISANQATRQIAGMDLLALSGNTHLISEDQQRYYTPTELGTQAGGISAVKVNQLLADAGLQHKENGHWQPTTEGRVYGRLFDTGKTHNQGLPVQQLKWSQQVLLILEAATMAREVAQ